MTVYESALGMIFHNGKKMHCTCGYGEFRVEVDTDPTRYWCDCGKYWTENDIDSMAEESV